MTQPTPGWRKSSHSINSGMENCVEVAGASGTVLVRDTTNRDGATLAVNVGAWSRFTSSVK